MTWIFTGRTDAEAETPGFCHLMQKESTHWKRPWCWEDWGQEEKRMTEDEMVGCHHRLDGHGFEQALRVGDGQGSLACCSPWGRKEPDTTEWLNKEQLLHDKAPRRQYRQNIFWHKPSRSFLRSVSKTKEESKNKQTGHNQAYKLCTAKEKWKWSCSVVSDSLRPRGQ